MKPDFSQQLADRFNELQIPNDFKNIPHKYLVNLFSKSHVFCSCDRPDGKISVSIFPPTAKWRTVLRVLKIL